MILSAKYQPVSASHNHRVLTGRSGPRSSGHSSLVQSLVFTQQPACSSIGLSNEFTGRLSSLTNLDDIFQLLLTNLRSRQVQLSSPYDLFLLFELFDLGFSSSYELLSLVGFASIIISLALLSFLFLLFDFLRSLSFGCSERGADWGSKDFSGFFGCVVETRSWAVFKGNVGVVLQISVGPTRYSSRLTSIPFLFFFGRRLVISIIH